MFINDPAQSKIFSYSLNTRVSCLILVRQYGDLPPVACVGGGVGAACGRHDAGLDRADGLPAS